MILIPVFHLESLQAKGMAAETDAESDALLLLYLATANRLVDYIKALGRPSRN